MWWLWLVGGTTVWLIIAVASGMVLGRSIRLADQCRAAASAPQAGADREPLEAVFARSAAVVRRRTVPLPPVAIVLLVAVVGLETVGFVLQSTGATGAPARLLAMNGADSIPRLLVAALFAITALTALAGAARLPERRAWWAAVALVAGTIAVVKFANPVHAVDYPGMSRAVGSTATVLLTALAAAAVGVSLWLASRSDQRDRRRVLGALALYAAAALGIGGASVLTGGSGRWVLALTYAEEAGQAIGGIALLVAVLAGVAPRLVLPADWALRRAADAHTLEVVEPRTGRAGPRDATG